MNKVPIKILHLEDDKNDALLVKSILSKADIKFEYLLTDSEETFKSSLEMNDIDIILSDFHLPDYTGSEALLFVREKFPYVPFVFLSGTMGEDAAIGSLLSGATDYVLKNRLERLVPAIYRAIKESQMRQARLQMEKQLLQSEENFRRSISESPLGIRIVTVNGKTVYANKAFLDIYDFESLEEFVKKPVKELYSHESYARHLKRKELRLVGKETAEYEVSIVRKNKEIRHIRILRNEVFWNGEKHYQVINQDITLQQKLTADLIAAKVRAEESDRLKSAFLANLSHEIRTPMNGILGFAELLKEPKLSTEEAHEYVSIIEKSGVRMLNLLEEIITISKIESGQIQLQLMETNIDELVEQIFHTYKKVAEEKGLKLSFKNAVPSGASIIITDRNKVYEVLVNLVKNAIKFSDLGFIEFGYNLIGRGHVTFVQFYVKDQGIGVPKERQKAIFERFIQADIGDKRAFQGIGLGLSISKAYVEMLGGQIWVESDPDGSSGQNGSNFCFTLPLRPGNHKIGQN
ncbi:MAG: ATP-binding protein [Prolixibacteraceae bacterium]|jgi:PAS domain S-box-containing protein|nr:ATP-binding protein [Prolixibacteraceae bacterium]